MQLYKCTAVHRLRQSYMRPVCDVTDTNEKDTDICQRTGMTCEMESYLQKQILFL